MAADDFIRLNTHFIGQRTISLDKVGLTWPPPERIIVDIDACVVREPVDGDDPDFIMKRTRMSELTDEQMKKCPNVCRGAEYHYEEPLHGRTKLH